MVQRRKEEHEIEERGGLLICLRNTSLLGSAGLGKIHKRVAKTKKKKDTK